MPLRILAVCTGNVCRSPLVEHLLRDRLLPDAFDVVSAGTRAMAGEPMTESALEMGRRLQLRYAGEHRGRQLAESDIRRADLILGLERDHRRQVAELVPAAVRRTVTLREFADIILALPPDTPDPASEPTQQVIRTLERALLHRGLQPRPADPRAHDIVDPYGQGFSAYESSTAAIVSAVDTIATYLNSAADLNA